MRKLLSFLYHQFTEPVYKRLSRDLTVYLQSTSRSNLDFQSRFAQRLFDELISLHQRLDASPGEFGTGNSMSRSTEEGYTPQQIVAILEEMKYSSDKFETCKKHQISLETMRHWQVKFSDLPADAVSGLQTLQAENAELKRMIGELTMENRRLQASGEDRN